MSAFDTAMRRINTIPSEVLKQAFMPVRYDPTRKSRFYDNTIPVTTDSIIKDQVIMGRVMKDIDLVSGSEVPISLADAEWEILDPYNTIYRFSDVATGGRTITSVFEVTYGFTNAASVGAYSGYGNHTSRSSMMLKSARDVLRGSVGMAATSTAYVQIVGHNTIMISDITPVRAYGILRCQVSNDPNLNNLKPQYHQKFAGLCLLAAKSMVYTKLVIELDEGMLRGGQQIGRFREIVDSYTDAETMYIEELEKWQKIGILNDPIQARRTMRLALGIRPKL